MVPIIARHGERLVDDAGRAALGYPGTWATDRHEIYAIKKYLEKF
jgi:hypothetical protein